jgi:hypothetical protein
MTKGMKPISYKKSLRIDMCIAKELGINLEELTTLILNNNLIAGFIARLKERGR